MLGMITLLHNAGIPPERVRQYITDPVKLDDLDLVSMDCQFITLSAYLKSASAVGQTQSC